jgi:hypothetical protein
VTPVSVSDENTPEFGVVLPIAGGDERYVPRFCAVGAIALPVGDHPRKYVPVVVGDAINVDAPALDW